MGQSRVVKNVVMVAVLAAVVALTIAFRAWLTDALAVHPLDAWLWRDVLWLLPVFSAAMWCVSMALRRIDRAGPAPVPAMGPVSRVGAALAVGAGAAFFAAFLALAAFPGEDLSEVYPPLKDGLLLGTLSGAATALVLAVATAAPAALSVWRLRRQPAKVTAIVALPHVPLFTVRAILAPGPLGGPVSIVLVDGKEVATICPGQAIGLTTSESTLTIAVVPRTLPAAQRERAAAAKVELALGTPVTVVFRGHSTRAPRVIHHPADAPLELTSRPFSGRMASFYGRPRSKVGPPAVTRASATPGTNALGLAQEPLVPPVEYMPSQTRLAVVKLGGVLAVPLAWLAGFAGGAALVTLWAQLDGPDVPSAVTTTALLGGGFATVLGAVADARRVLMRVPWMRAPRGVAAVLVGGLLGALGNLGDAWANGAVGLVTAGVFSLAIILMATMIMVKNSNIGRTRKHVRAWSRSPAEATSVIGQRQAGSALRLLTCSPDFVIGAAVDGSQPVRLSGDSVPALWVRPGPHTVTFLAGRKPLTVEVVVQEGHTTTVRVGVAPLSTPWFGTRKARLLASVDAPQPVLPD